MSNIADATFPRCALSYCGLGGGDVGFLDGSFTHQLRGLSYAGCARQYTRIFTHLLAGACPNCWGDWKSNGGAGILACRRVGEWGTFLSLRTNSNPLGREGMPGTRGFGQTRMSAPPYTIPAPSVKLPRKIV